MRSGHAKVNPFAVAAKKKKAMDENPIESSKEELLFDESEYVRYHVIATITTE